MSEEAKEILDKVTPLDLGVPLSMHQSLHMHQGYEQARYT